MTTHGTGTSGNVFLTRLTAKRDTMTDAWYDWFKMSIKVLSEIYAESDAQRESCKRVLDNLWTKFDDLIDENNLHKT